MLADMNRLPLPLAPLAKRPTTLDPVATQTVLTVARLCGSRHPVAGPVQQQLAASLLESPSRDPAALGRRLYDLLGELHQSLALPLANRHRWRAQFDRAWEEARRLHQGGLRMVRFAPGRQPPPGPNHRCTLLAYRGRDLPPGPWVGVFNSRKPRRMSEDERWVQALRWVLEVLSRHRITWIGSTGTLTYELVAAHALRRRLPLVMVPPLPPSAASVPHPLLPDPRQRQDLSILSCFASRRSCPPSTRMVCRDAWIAALADLQVILEIRPGGNLEQILRCQRHHRTVWFLAGTKTDGSGSLLSRLPADPCVRLHPFHLKQPPMTQPPAAPEPDKPAQADHLPGVAAGLPQHGYLYHYTRSCPGPWPDQPLRDYLEDILDNSGGWTHDALATLARILRDGRLRGTARMIRGATAAVSWTALSPMEINRLRQWRRGLARWTLEPYGIGVRREVLRNLGAAPAIYLPPHKFDRLGDAQRYRYQRHQPPRCDWKYEREWRLKGDLELARIARHDAFVFVASTADAARLRRWVDPLFPVVALANPDHHP